MGDRAHRVHNVMGCSDKVGVYRERRIYRSFRVFIKRASNCCHIICSVPSAVSQETLKPKSAGQVALLGPEVQKQGLEEVQSQEQG